MSFSANRLLRWLALHEFRASRAEFYRDLAEMYRRGEAMLSFLEGELANAARTGQRSRAAALRQILARFVAGADAGRLEHLLRDVMPASDAMMIAGVERSPRKADALLALAEAVEQQAAMKKLILGYSILPLAILPVCVVLIWIVSGVLSSIDKSTPVYVRDQVWRGFNGLAKVIADFSLQFGPVALIALGAAIVALLWSLPRWRGPLRLKADRLPLYSLYRDFQAGLLFSSMAMLLKTGGSLRGTIEDLAARASPVMRWHLMRVLRALDDAPTRTIEAFGRGVLSPYLLARAATLNRTAASFADVLIELGTKEGGRVLARVNRAAVVANVALVSILGGVAAVLGLASITVPGTFASVMEPTSLMAARQAYELSHPLGDSIPNPAVRRP
jgi:hypothetical protein